jgi:hypothetical protein
LNRVDAKKNESGCQVWRLRACVTLLPGGTLWGQPHIAADGRALADGDAAQNGGPRVDDDVVFHDGMPCMAFDEVAFVVGGEALGAQRDGLIEPNALADDGGLADDDARAVVDEEGATDLGAGMDVDAGPRMRDVGDQTGQQRRAQPVQRMRQPVVDDGRHPWVAQQDLGNAGGCGVALVGCLKIADEQSADVRQLGGERPCDVAGPLGQPGVGQWIRIGVEQQTSAHLFGQQNQRAIQSVADVIVDAGIAQVRAAEVRRKQRGGEALNDLNQSVARWQLADAAFVADVVRMLPGVAQRLHHFIQIPFLDTGVVGCGKQGGS